MAEILTTKDKLYPERLYYAMKTTGSQTVFFKDLPDGSPELLPLQLSLKIADHSPDGFNWGFGGSGAAQLSLALLLNATSDPDISLKYYTYFEWDLVVKFEKKWTLLRSDILAWLEKEKAKELYQLHTERRN